MILDRPNVTNRQNVVFILDLQMRVMLPVKRRLLPVINIWVALYLQGTTILNTPRANML